MDIPPLIEKYISKLPYLNAYKDLIDAFGYTAEEAVDILVSLYNLRTFKDLTFIHHQSIPESEFAVQGYYEFPNGTWVSVVGGDNVGLYGNGKTDFEVYSSEMNDPYSYADEEKVNEIMIDLQDPNKYNTVF